MEHNLYHYRAIVSSVDNGDTCVVDIDLGLGTWMQGETLHLSRIHAPRLSGKEKQLGRVARDFLHKQIQGREVHIQTIKVCGSKNGGYLAEVWLKSDDNGWINVNDLMVNAGQAVYKG